MASPEVAAAVGGDPRRLRWARAITDRLSPPNVLLAGLALLGVLRYGSAGVGWAALTALFCAGLPMVALGWGVRRGIVADHYLSRRRHRLIGLPVAMASVCAGFSVLTALGAPQDLRTAVAAMLAGGAAVLLITLVWKVSLHTSAVSAVATVLALTLGPCWGLGALLAIPVGWSRIALGDHTAAQTVVGALLAPLTTLLVFFLRP